MIDNYIYVIVALLPLSALMLVLQTNPYHALVVRAILGAIAALVYSVLGGADVALTEALVGTMLAVTLYVIAVRSSLVMKMGILEDRGLSQSYLQEAIAHFRKIIDKHHLRLELVEYPDLNALNQALLTKEVHAICNPIESSSEQDVICQATIRVRRLFEILQTEFTFPDTTLKYMTVPTSEEQH